MIGKCCLSVRRTRKARGGGLLGVTLSNLIPSNVGFNLRGVVITDTAGSR